MKRSTTVRNFFIIAVFTAICVVGMEFLAVNIGQGVPFAQNYTLHAYFSDADGVPTAADVRVGGVNVGRVTAVGSDAAHPGETIVTIEITDSHAIPVYTDGYASVQPKTLLGEKYIELTVGNRAQADAIQSGGSLPPSQTGHVVENDEVFNAFDAQARQQTQQVLAALNAATEQRAGNVQNILPQLQQVVQGLGPVAHVYEQDQPQVDGILTQLNTILATLADEHNQVAGLLSNGSTALTAVSQKDAALSTFLDQAGGFFAQLNQAASASIQGQEQAIAALKPSLDAQTQFLDQVVGPQCGGHSCGIDQVFTGTLTGNINYPNDQLNVTTNGTNNPVAGINPELVTNEWDSMFSQPKTSPPHRALNIVLSLHCNEITSTLNNPTLNPSGDTLGPIEQQVLNALKPLGITC
jgi:phospholipid/cholesterol/gamma-HCH transport system substrate-binding protein